MSIPNEIYDNFFDLFDSGYTFKEAFIKSQLNKYMTDKEYIQKFRNDVEEIRDIFDKTRTFLNENEKFLIEHPEILNPLKDKLLSISEEIER